MFSSQIPLIAYKKSLHFYMLCALPAFVYEKRKRREKGKKKNNGSLVALRQMA